MRPAWRPGAWHTWGARSPLMMVFAELGKLSKEERPAVGQAPTRSRWRSSRRWPNGHRSIKQQALAKSLEEEKLDVTLPGRGSVVGRLHPSTQQLRRVLDILAEMGFQVYTSREVETDEMNFQLLNFPPHHPAREMQDSFYVDAGESRGRTRTRSCCARTPRPARSAPCASSPPATRRTRRPSASPCRACASATSRSPPAPRCSSTRWKAWWWARTSPSPI